MAVDLASAYEYEALHRHFHWLNKKGAEDAFLWVLQ